MQRGGAKDATQRRKRFNAEAQRRRDAETQSSIRFSLRLSSGRSPDRAHLWFSQRKFWAEGPNETGHSYAHSNMPPPADTGKGHERHQGCVSGLPY